MYHGQNIVAELDAQNNVTAKYNRGLGLISRDKDGEKMYYLMDGHGSVIRLTSRETKKMEIFHYDAFGNEQQLNENNTNPFRYCGQYFDKETGNLYLRARYYNSSNGRFTTEDPAFDGLNWYVYCNNNPINSVDPTGLWVLVISGVGQAQCGVGVEAGAGIAIDGNGNFAAVLSAGVGAGSPSAGGGVQIAFYTYDNASQLEGFSFELGGSGTVGLGVGATFGVDVIMNGDGIVGESITIGAGAGLPGEGHGYVSYTFVQDIKAGYDTAYTEALLTLNSILPDEVKEYLNKNVFNDYILIPGSTANNVDDYKRDFENSGYLDKWIADGGYLE